MSCGATWGPWSFAIDPEDPWLFLAPALLAVSTSNMAATLEMFTEIETLVTGLAVVPITVSSVRSAIRMPPDQGGIAGWLRFYVGTGLVGFAAGIPTTFAWAAQAGFSTAGVVVVALVGLAVSSPRAIAPLIKRPRARTVTIWWLYGAAAIEILLLTVSGQYEISWVTWGSYLAWGTYFLRSKRVKATYLPKPAEPR